MKKLVLTLAVCLSAITMYAQNWSIGGRVGAGFQFDAQYDFGDQYVEGRFGAGFLNSPAVSADFTALYNWKLFDWADWTPNAGTWFFDAGCGINVGGGAHWAYVGPAGMAKFGIAFNEVPIKLSVDWTPSLSCGIAYDNYSSYARFNGIALANFALTCVVEL